MAVHCTYRMRLWMLSLLLGTLVLKTESVFTPKSVEGKLVVPDTARIDNALLKSSEADKFLSLWFIYLLAEPVHISSDPWTLLIPKNTGLPKSGGFLEDREATQKILLNHAVLGQVIDAHNPPQRPAPVTLSGTPLIFTKDSVGPMVNGVRMTGEEYKLAEGVVYVIDSSIPVLDFGGPTRAPNREGPTRAPSRGGSTRAPSRSSLPFVTSSAPRRSTLPTSSSPTSIPPLTHRFATHKPRQNHFPSNLKPETPVEIIPEDIEPVFGADLLGDIGGVLPDPDFGSDLGSGSAISEPAIPTRRRPTAASAPSGPRPTSTFNEFAGSGNRPSKDKTFLTSFLDSLQTTRSHTGSEFLHHFGASNISDKFRDAGRYTALVPYDSAFYQYYPIDWGFNPFLVSNFTKDVIMNHFIRGNVALEDLPNLAELTTLGGKIIKFIRKGNKLLGNGVEVVFESETTLSRGRSYVVQDLLFVDHERIMDLQAAHGDLETAPLLGDPWPTSQFLSHLFDRLQQEERTSFFAEYLNLTNLAYLLPGHDENLDPLKYSAFIPLDNAIASILYSEEPDPFALDEVLREKLILNHLVRGRMYEDDLEDGTMFTNLANSTMRITKEADGTLKINGVEIIEPQKYVYNLGVLYFINGVLGVTEQDVVVSLNKLPATNLEPTKVALPLPSLVPQKEPKTTEAPPLTILAPRTTTSRPTSRQPTHTFRPFAFPRASTTNTPTTTFNFQLTTAKPAPTATTPRVRFETRTEISISRQINDGDIEPVAVNSTS